MLYDRMFQFLVCSPSLRDGSLGGERLRRMIDEAARLGIDTIRAADLDEAELAVETDAAIGCVVLEWGAADWQAEGGEFIAFVRAQGLEMPIFLLARKHLLQEIPVEVLAKVSGYVFLEEDTPEFVARNLVSHLEQYAETLRTPFFGAMVDYAEQGNQVWTCPGHNGGVFYRKSPIGRVFVEHLGEAVFRNDLDNSVVELGDLLTHEGPALRAQKEAAEIFGADRTYFVLNGTSTSNKIVLSSLLAPGDLVLFDRNNHKAAHHGALLLGGAIPIYVETRRNAHGLIGPMEYETLDEDVLRERIRRHPLVSDPQAWLRPRPFRAAVLEQCSYDGTIYDVRMLLARLRHLCDYIVFDEAWAGFMKFHPLYEGRYAMGLEDLTAEDPGIFATQSTHKQLAGFSQASQIHVKDAHIKGQSRRIEHRRFNETFLLHASTSPFYPLFASLDVGAQMMKGRSGRVLWDKTIRLGIELRKKIRAIRAEIEREEPDPARRWFFEPFVPDAVIGPDGRRIRWEEAPTDFLASDPACWILESEAAWHGFGPLPAGYAMTDPNKLTLLTPGFEGAAGKYAAAGVPAPILAEFLRENRIVPEKNDLNSILFLLTPGLESSKAGTLLSALVTFKKLHDQNAPLVEVLPEFLRRHPGRYETQGLRDLCLDMHGFYRDHDASWLQRAQFRAEHFPEPALSPQAAIQAMQRNEVDYLPLTEVKDRIAATLALVYPPGIGVIVPGERYDERAQPMLDYLAMFEAASNRFPGFDNEIQGVYRETAPDGSVRLYTYVVKE